MKPEKTVCPNCGAPAYCSNVLGYSYDDERIKELKRMLREGTRVMSSRPSADRLDWISKAIELLNKEQDDE
jgi:hypothetical protein